ncbi:MAG: sugar phosphate isomerase/epimerase family protein [Methanosarcinaceae archaeon]
MKLKRTSFSSRAVIDDPFSWAYELEDCGYTGWEIVQEGNQCLTSKSIIHIQDICDTTDLELTLHLPFSDMNLASLNTGIHNEVLHQMEDYLTLASGFVELAVVHPGYLSPYGAQLPDLAWQANINSLQFLCDFAADYGIMITVENMPEVPMVFGKYPQEMLRMVEETKRDNAGLTLDIGHANTMGTEIMDDFLKMYKSRISHVHLHDNMGKKDEHLPLGRGNIDWKQVLNSLSGYKGRFVTEVNCLEEGVESLAFLKSL